MPNYIILICGLLLYEGKIIDHLNPTSKMTNILTTNLIENFHNNKIIMIISKTWSKTRKSLFYNLIFQHLKTMLKFKNWMTKNRHPCSSWVICFITVWLLQTDLELDNMTFSYLFTIRRKRLRKNNFPWGRLKRKENLFS